MSVIDTTLIDSTDATNEKVIWHEYHNVRSDSSGNYRIIIGEPTEFLDVDIQRMRFANDTFYCEIKRIDKESEYTVARERIMINHDFSFSVSDSIKNNITQKDNLKIIISTMNRKGKAIWTEEQKGEDLLNSKNVIGLGKGKIILADRDYFEWTPCNYYINITTPLDYSKAVLMLGFLGILGLVFALLLKREDKTSGFGLELPNKTE